MARRRSGSGRGKVTKEQVERKHLRLVQEAAAIAGVPDAQRGANDIDRVPTVQVGNEPTPVKFTVRRLTAIEKLARAGVLERHHKAACEWYADAYELGFMTQRVTANYEGASGGGCTVGDILAGHKAQMMARADYLWARTLIPTMYLTLFERLIINQDKLSAVAADSFSQKRTQARQKTVAALQLCANMLFDSIKAMLPIDLETGRTPAPAKAAAPAVAAPIAPAEPERPAMSVSDTLSLAIDEAALRGVTVGKILLADFTHQMLEKELGRKVEALWQIPIEVTLRGAWGYALMPAEETPPIAA